MHLKTTRFLRQRLAALKESNQMHQTHTDDETFVFALEKGHLVKMKF